MSDFDDGESTTESAGFSTPSASSSDISTTGSMSIISSGSAPAADTSSSPKAISFADEHLYEEDSDAPNSLPSSSDSDSDFDYDGASDAEREWKESLQQLQLMLSMVIVPYMGRYFGRKCAYWGWKRWMEWRYPVEVVVTSRLAFEGAGAVAAAAAL